MGEVRAEVHVVVLVPSGGGPCDEPDPIGVAVFCSREGADRDAARRRAEGVPHETVWSLPVGWRRPGWPFDPSAPARSISGRG